MTVSDWFIIGVIGWGITTIIAVRFISKKIDEIDEADL